MRCDLAEKPEISTLTWDNGGIKTPATAVTVRGRGYTSWKVQHPMFFDSASVNQSSCGFIYVMECEGFYKIGWTTNPRHRRFGLQTGSPFPITLVGVIEGSIMNEAEWHEAFEDKRVRGEWFALTEEDVSRVLHDSFGIDQLPGEFDVA